MKKYALTFCLALGLVMSLTAAALPAHAQSENTVVADIPFDFSVRGTTLSAGNYSIAVQSGTSVLTIRDAARRHSMAVITNAAPAHKASRDGQTLLVFNKYGDQYFLSKISRPEGESRSLLPSRRERSLRKELKMAKHAASIEPEVIYIAAVMN